MIIQWKFTIIALLLRLSPFVLRYLQLLLDFIKIAMGLPKESALNIGTKSVKVPFAQNAILCDVLTSYKPIVRKALCLASEHSPWPIPMRVVIDLQLRFGFRISEVLSIRPGDILTLEKLRIRASKRGKDRIVNYSDSFGYLEFCKKTGSIPFNDYNRFFFYRAYKKEGIMLFHEKDKKYSVTHSFRHLLVQQLSKEIEESELISDVVGHKSSKSLESYL